MERYDRERYGEDQDAPEHEEGWAPRYDLINMLLTVSWLGELTREQLQRVCFPQIPPATVRRLLWRVRREDLLEYRTWSVTTRKRRDGRPIPTYRSPLRRLTKAGHALISGEPQYPTRLRTLRSTLLIPHDALVTETVVRIIELGRSVGLSGLWVSYEVQLDPAKTRPVMDAFVVARLGGAAVLPFMVPWTNDVRGTGEKSGRLALEIDRGTEGRREIELKALAYAQAGTPAWVEQYGAFPVPTWVVPSHQRLTNILRWWAEAWPGGRWLMATEAGLQRDQWTEYRQGQVAARALFRQANAAPLVWVPVGEWLAGAAAAQSTAPNETAAE